jgi:hypothetical protein
VSLVLQLASEIGVVIELAVLDRNHRTFLVQERLVTALDVHNGEPADPESNARRRVRSTIVGAAVGHDVGHVVELFRRDELARLSAHLYDSADSTHLQFLRLERTPLRPDRYYLFVET